GRLESTALQGPTHFERVQNSGGSRERCLVEDEVDRCGEQHHIGVGLVQRNVQPTRAQLLYDLYELLLIDPEQGVLSHLLVLHGTQLRRRRTSRSQRLARNRDGLGDVNAHGTHQIAAPALRARGESQLCPFVQLLCRDLAQKELVQPPDRRQLAT